MKLATRPAVSMVLVVLVLVLIVAAAGVGYYFITASSGSSNSSSSSSQSSSSVSSSSSSSSSSGSSSSSSSSSSTQSSSSQSSSQSSSTSSSSTSSTTSCSATTTGTGSSLANALAVIQTFQALHVEYASTNATGYTTDYVADMDVVQVTSSAYTVNVTESSAQVPGGSYSVLVKVEKSGTVDWAYSKIGGFVENLTGSQATLVFETSMVFFELESGNNSVYNYALLTQYFHPVNGTQSIYLTNAASGKTVEIDYQTYVANSANETFGYCGSNFSYTSFTVEIGTIHNSNVQVLLNFKVKGIADGNAVDFSLNLLFAWLESS